MASPAASSNALIGWGCGVGAFIVIGCINKGDWPGGKLLFVELAPYLAMAALVNATVAQFFSRHPISLRLRATGITGSAGTDNRSYEEVFGKSYDEVFGDSVRFGVSGELLTPGTFMTGTGKTGAEGPD